jgi:ectoine hydroxylase-related dioxygenase (phytanoyl-CoA dioxygenase family)
MTSEDVLSQPARVLSQEQRAFFFDEGYVCAPGLIDAEWLARLRAALDELVERSRGLDRSDGTFDLETGHSAEAPRLRRVAFLDDLHPVFWEFVSWSVLADVAADLLGPDVTFRDAMANFKWAHGGQEVKWHQDIPFYPHTNLSPAQFLVLLEDVGPDQGPLQVVPRSQRGPIIDHYDEDGRWLGHIPPAYLGGLGLERAVALTGPAGTVTVHHGVTIHGSAANRSAKGRPALSIGYNPADALPYTAPAYRSSHFGALVRGAPARFARHDPVRMRLPPDWSGGYTSIFAHQKGEDPRARGGPEGR